MDNLSFGTVRARTLGCVLLLGTLACSGGGTSSQAEDDGGPPDSADAGDAGPQLAGPVDKAKYIEFASKISEGRSLALYTLSSQEFKRFACVDYSAAKGECDFYFVHDGGVEPWASVKGGTCAFEDGGPNVMLFRFWIGDGTVMSTTGQDPTVSSLGIDASETIYSDDKQLGPSNANHILFVPSCP